jgi:Ca-activated chloride channel family protein
MVRSRFIAGTQLLQLVLLVCLVVIATAVWAQSDSAAVHLLPDENSIAHFSGAWFRADVDLVLVNVTVLDESHRAVKGLNPADFELLENKQPQSIKYFSSEDQPLSIVIVMDASASMAPRMDQVRQSVRKLIQSSNAQDEVSVITVGDKPGVPESFADPAEDVARRISIIQPEGRTALWDAMVSGVERLEHSNYARKAMVVISDGGDNQSRYTENELKSRLEEADVELYALGLFDPFPRRVEERRGPQALDELCSSTGGRLLFAQNGEDIKRDVEQLNDELRHQYVVGYHPSSRLRDGQWRKLKVNLHGQPPRHKLHVYAKQGYHAPSG